MILGGVSLMLQQGLAAAGADSAAVEPARRAPLSATAAAVVAPHFVQRC
jgi:hypothetical protein